MRPLPQTATACVRARSVCAAACAHTLCAVGAVGVTAAGSSGLQCRSVLGSSVRIIPTHTHPSCAQTPYRCRRMRGSRGEGRCRSKAECSASRWPASPCAHPPTHPPTHPRIQPANHTHAHLPTPRTHARTHAHAHQHAPTHPRTQPTNQPHINTQARMHARTHALQSRSHPLPSKTALAHRSLHILRSNSATPTALDRLRDCRHLCVCPHSMHQCARVCARACARIHVRVCAGARRGNDAQCASGASQPESALRLHRRAASNGSMV